MDNSIVMSTIKTENGLRIQTAGAGMMLTNGKTYTQTVYLGDGAMGWDEIPESEVPEITDEVVENLIN